jgi:hypothetical protein
MQGVDPDKFTAFNVLEDQELRAGMLCLFAHVYEATCGCAIRVGL